MRIIAKSHNRNYSTMLTVISRLWDQSWVKSLTSQIFQAVSSSAIRGLSGRLLKDAMSIMLEEFSYLMNLSMHSGRVPQAWKIATVVPIPKTPNPKQVTDLRPILILPIPGKILEKFVHQNLMEFINQNQILSDTQFGFGLAYKPQMQFLT